MRIIISPAKKMKVDTDVMAYQDLPVFLEKTEILKNWIQDLSFGEAQELWKCNDKIAEQNFRRYQEMNLRGNLTPAILSYEGIQYQYMAPAVFEKQAFQYIQKNLRILSGFYGVLKPFDGVTPYRLEMQAKAKVGDFKDLYDFWKDELYEEVIDESRIIVNLASKEYSKCVEKYLRPEDTYITVVFGEYNEAGKIVQKGTFAKMARGEMVRFMAEENVERPEQIKAFDRLGYRFEPEVSTDTEYKFIKIHEGMRE